ncbi:SDR family NAD(P)-dependent oxidoreductase [Actinophytocola sp.]|uniref:SDR family NAD(P)-dependent oxidoreductase n=1 Tax=Actinophytocola sp. TaxID=1872138 RepID=UPI003D6A7CB7
MGQAALPSGRTTYPDLIRLDGQTQVVLGAGQGIGREAARALSQAGATVVCVDVDSTRRAAVVRETDGIDIGADVTRRDDLRRVAREAKQATGRLDGVIDVVGRALWKPLLETDEDDVASQFQVSFGHAVPVLQELADAFTAGGAVTFVTSLAAHSGAPGAALYGAAKAGLVSLVRSAAVELGPAGVRVNAVSPGYTRTARSRPLPAAELARRVGRVPLRRVGTAADIAAALLYLQSGLAGFITGQVLVVDGGVSTRPTYE